MFFQLIMHVLTNIFFVNTKKLSTLAVNTVYKQTAPFLLTSMVAAKDRDVCCTPSIAGHLKTPVFTPAHGTGHMPSREPEDITRRVFKEG